jgi:hypothetical protein
MLTFKTTLNALNNVRFVYHVSNNDGIIFVGIGTIPEIVSMRQLLQNPAFNINELVTVQAIEPGYSNMRDAENALGLFVRNTLGGNTPYLNKTFAVNRYMPVKHDQTGIIYRNAAECCRINNIPSGTMSRHLAKIPGHKTIKGQTYSYSQFYDGFATRKPSF